jgi:NAD(P)-dependent dehydrogenase (short-subunit alcohol dehydrogenase family)
MKIIILGATGGIGLKLVPVLASKYNLVCTYRVKDKLELFKDYKNIEFSKLDLNEDEEIKSFCEYVKEIDDKIVVVNLLTISVNKLFINLTQEDWNNNMNMNINYHVQILQSIIYKMISDKWGRVINISSIVAQNCNVGTSSYASSKAAVIALSNTIAHEYGRFNITSNVLTLGYFNTGLIDYFSDDEKAKILNKVPSKKFGNTKDIVSAIEFIINTEYLNGAQIKIDGGIQ